MKINSWIELVVAGWCFLSPVPLAWAEDPVSTDPTYKDLPGSESMVSQPPDQPAQAKPEEPKNNAAAAQPEASAADGHDFSAEARLLSRVVACNGEEPFPPNVEAKLVETHCKELKIRMEAYQKKYIDKAMAFIATLRPAGLPQTVVYPFGGGDLLSALTTYPEATKYITVSLEHGGDPRRIWKMKTSQLKATLNLIRRGAGGLLVYDNSLSTSLSSLDQSDIPGQLALFLVALAVHGEEPVSLRYFRIEPDGSIHYLSDEDIAAFEGQKAKKLHHSWVNPNSSVAFSNLELRFRKIGSGPNAPLRIHQHIAANIRDDALGKDPPLIKFLDKEGPISAMTKAASYCLSDNRFSQIRNYLLEHMEFMISDSTGIPPRLAKNAGFTMETYGKFEKALLKLNDSINSEWRKFYKSQPYRPLAFRYGYVDGFGFNHMLITRKAPKPDQAAQPEKPTGSASDASGR